MNAKGYKFLFKKIPKLGVWFKQVAANKEKQGHMKKPDNGLEQMMIIGHNMSKDYRCDSETF